MTADARDLARRDMLSAAAAFGASAALVTAGGLLVPAYAAEAGKGEKKGSGGEQVTATEDLMREHGVLRRTLIVYAELARRLPAHPDAIDPAAPWCTEPLDGARGRPGVGGCP